MAGPARGKDKIKRLFITPSSAILYFTSGGPGPSTVYLLKLIAKYALQGHHIRITYAEGTKIENFTLQYPTLTLRRKTK